MKLYYTSEEYVGMPSSLRWKHVSRHLMVSLPLLLRCLLPVSAQTAQTAPTPPTAQTATTEKSAPIAKIPPIPSTAAFTATGVTAQSFEDSVQAAMAPGLAAQRASIQKQASSSTEEKFFALAWPPRPAMSLGLSPGPICDPLPPEQLGPLVDQAAQRESVEADLVRAVIKQESGGRPCAISVKGAQGVMQLMPDTAQEFGVADPFDPKQNIDAGVKLLKSLLTKYKGDVSLALAAYNAGSAQVDKDKAIPQIPETVNYVSDILEELNKKKP